MTIDVNNPIWCRYYQVPPHKKSLDQCRSHGSDHRAYQWSPQIDPRWSDEQKEAYLDGYEDRQPALAAV